MPPSGCVQHLRVWTVGKWLYLARTLPDVADLFQPLEIALRSRFIPTLTGRAEPGDLERALLSLPARFGG